MIDMNISDEYIKAIGKDNVILNEPMCKHTTFKIGGNADVFVMPTSVEDVVKCIQIAKDNGVPFYIVGNGSNLLVKDNGYRGVVIQLYRNFGGVEVDGNKIVCRSGALLSSVSKEALKNSLTGLEFASGIPGTLGGAICMNAGAYGGEMKNVVKSVTVIKDGAVVTLDGNECDFGYRKSRIMSEGMIVLEAVLELEHGNYDDIKSKMDELSKMRVEKQPLEYPSAGSTFKRPEGYFAGKLIDDCGLRGFRVGDAQISEKHCGFVVNRGKATAADVIELMKKVNDIVTEKFGVGLEPEVRIIGE
jgi:UDP-N-acetylmuramate dehydrogenase